MKDSEGDHFCRCCDQEFALRTGKEPSDYCDDCAQTLVPLLYRELMKAQTTLLEAYATRLKLTGIPGGKLKAQIDGITAVMEKAEGRGT